jgi:transposase-like protein
MYGPQTKGQVLALLLTGESLHEIERETGVPRTTLRRWSAEFKQTPIFRDIARRVNASLGPGWDFSSW